MTRTFPLTLALLILTLCGVSSGAQEVVAEEKAPIEFMLHPVQEGFNNSLNIVDRGAEVVFKKEPEYAGTTVHRHALRFGSGPSDFFGMAFDVAANTLYIDRNRNLDLTDDGPGVQVDGSNSWWGDFPDVVIETVHEGIPVRYVLDITIIGSFYSSATVISGWQAEVEIDGASCLVGLSDNLDGVFDGNDTLRLDHNRHREARLETGRSEDVPLPKWFYFEGTVYSIESAFREMDGETVVAVTLVPVTEDLMDISFEGRFVSRVVLKDPGEAYGLLEWPDPEMRIPRGSYGPYQVDVLDSFTGFPKRAPRVESEGNTVLRTGGPLNQEVRVRRSGAYLSLNYLLQGEDGTLYSPNQEEEPPGFVVYRGDRRIAVGQFEYG